MTTEQTRQLNQTYNLWVEQLSDSFEPLPELCEFLNSPKGQSLITCGENQSVLELGCGARSIFSTHKLSSFNNSNILAIDLSQVAINYARTQYPGAGNIHYSVYDALDLYDVEKFQLIVDAHCIHTVTTDRELLLENLYQALIPGGKLLLEAMVSHKGMLLDPGYQLEKNILYKGEQATRYIPSAIELEYEIIAAGFEIEYFCASEGMKIIPNDQRQQALASDPDLFRIIAKKGG
ncbi:MAG: class I SAM-dependent methyltransferase [Halobacteriovoraceae bacterium]|jgi:SAM-dependent methyltransferase|nr:class I SAM-dependent methyltransferase [Halobacteriovoraceae bacterium]MBT5095448.1 class I SAM-dependent methyltransferase [Halobacteriovoraceae bacterium]